MEMIWDSVSLFNHIQEKTRCLEEVAGPVGLKINPFTADAVKVFHFAMLV